MISIYKVTNNINGKIYIGQTIKNIEKRFKAHCYKASNCIKLINAIQKYGKENFTIEFIAATEDQKEADKLEIFFINYFKSIENGYNISFGGSGGSMTGRHHTDKAKKLISEANSGDKHYMYGKHLSQDIKQKISEANSGEKSFMYGKHRSEETRRKLSESHIGKYHTLKTKLKMSESKSGEKHPMYGKTGKNSPLFGKHHTKETKLKISESKSGEKSINFGKPAINRKLTQETANKIREEYSTGNFTHRQLGKIYDVSYPVISNIINNKMYINK